MTAVEAMVFSFALPADVRGMRLLVTGLCLAAALLVAAAVIAVVRRWWQRRNATEDLSPSAQLAHFRSLYETGAISQEEFERLRTLLGGRMRESLGVPPPAAAKPAKPAPGENGQEPDKPETGIRPA
jgi:hypothetical protein